MYYYVALCPDPIAPDYGAVTITGNSAFSGDTATYTCSSGFELIGSAMANCTKSEPPPPPLKGKRAPISLNSAMFSPDPPSCERKSMWHSQTLLLTSQ